MKRITRNLALALSLFAFISANGPAVPQEPNPNIKVRDGYKLSIAVNDITEPRFMEFGPDQTLYVSRMEDGEIMASRDTDGDGVYETVTTFVTGHQLPHAMHWHDGWLWFAQPNGIFKARDTNGDGVSDEKIEVIGSDLLSGRRGHNWRSLLIHKGRIYTSIGDPGNVTDQRESKREKVWSYNLQGGDEKLFCGGIRNTEKLVVRPGTDEIWGMDHGSDWFGGRIERRGETQYGQPITDLNPPGEMNRYVEGGFYGHPFLVGNRNPRHEFLDHPELLKLAAETIPPEWTSGAHWAPNAMDFYTGDQFPGAKGHAFVAYHGSWNSSVPVGYCVTQVLFEDGHPYGERVFVNFVRGNNTYGRPVDVIMEPDGSLLISDDDRNKIYRLRYVGK